MTLFFLYNWILQIVILCLSLFSSYGIYEQNIKYIINNKLNSGSPYDMPNTILNNNENRIDTVTVLNVEELIKNIRSNRVIELVNNKYILKSTLLIDSIKNLKIVGNSFSELMTDKRNSTVLKLSNSYNIQLDSLIIGHIKGTEHSGEQGVLRISHCNNINISNCKLLGSGTMSLVTYDVNNLNFTNSEITKSTVLIFELEKSRNIVFRNSKFHNNNLATSVLGGFTNSTKDISFVNCKFLNNLPDQIGNPAFNFYDNYEEGDLEKKIIFTNCTFKNNNGFKWYGDNIKLNNCIIDSSGFIGFKRNNK